MPQVKTILRKVAQTFLPIPASKAPSGLVIGAQPQAGYSMDRSLSARRIPTLQPTDSGYSIAAQLVADVYACVMVRAQSIANVPIHVVVKGTEVPVKDSPWEATLAFAQKAFRQNLIYKHEWSLSIWGKNFELRLKQPHSDTPGGLQWLNPQAISINAPSGYIEDFLYNAGASFETFLPHLIGYNFYPHPDSDILGLSPILPALDAVNITRNAQAYIEAFFAHDASVGGIISGRSRSAALGNTPIPLTQEDRQLIMKMWKEQTQGSRKSFHTIMLPFELEFTQFEGRPPTAQIELTDDERRRIHQAMRVPMSLTYATDVADPLSAGNTLSQQEANFFENFVIPEHKSLMEFYNIHQIPWLAPGQELVGDYDQILAAINDTAERRAMYREDFRDGAITLNEFREKVGYETRESGDVVYLSSGVNVVPIADLGKPPLPALPASIPSREGEEPANTPTEEIIVSPTPLLDRHQVGQELRAWRKFIIRRVEGGLKDHREFNIEMIPLPWAVEVREGLQQAGDDLDAIKAVFDEAIDICKSITSRVDNFRKKFGQLVRTARRDNPIPKQRFRRTLLSEVKRFGRLFFSEGLIDGGVTDGVPDEDERALLNDLLAPFTTFVREFTNLLYRGEVTDAQAKNKPAMWAIKLMVLYQEGLVSANRNQMLLFTGKDGIDSLRTCQALKGQIHRAKVWRKRELRPGIDGHNFECGAWNCMHILKPVAARASGKIPSMAQIASWAMKTSDHTHDPPGMDEQPYTLYDWKMYYQTAGYTRKADEREELWLNQDNIPLPQ